MTLYYVRKTGSDSNAGTSTGAAWLTVDKAANTVAAGDTVYIGAGIYRELVTMDTAGTSGSLITYVGDVTGVYTGDAGPVIISAFDRDEETAARAKCWDTNAKEFIVVRGIVFVGTSTSGGFVVGDSATASHIAYEGCVFEQCSFIGCGTSIERNEYGVFLKLNNGATPSTNGIVFRHCKFLATNGLWLDSTNNASANVNLKIVIENCEFWAESTATSWGIGIVGTANTFSVGGVTVRNCTFIGTDNGVGQYLGKNTTNPVAVYNCFFYASSSYAIYNNAGTADCIVQKSNRFHCCTNTLSSGITFEPLTIYKGCWLPGFLAYHPFEFQYGWSPVKMLEPIKISGYTDPLIGNGNIDYVAATNDILNNPRQMGRIDKFGRWYYYNGSTTDSGAAWSNDANATDSSVATAAGSSTNGSTSSNYLLLEGTNAPGNGATILTVYARTLAAFTNTSGAAGSATFYTDAAADELGTIAHPAATTNTTWSDWTALSTPSGGWTWAKLQALEARCYKVSGATATFNVYFVQISVITAEVGLDIGAVEANTQPTQNSTDEYEGTYCMELAGAGQFTFWQPVSAASTTITVRAKYDANYTGTNPQLVVTNIPGVADQTDTVAGASGSYEQLSLSFTPTSAGFVRVKLVSNDTSATGKCFFDDILVS